MRQFITVITVPFALTHDWPLADRSGSVTLSPIFTNFVLPVSGLVNSQGLRQKTSEGSENMK